jgi:hypothetical protein
LALPSQVRILPPPSQSAARSLEHLLELRVEHILVSHGEPILGDGHSVLSAAIADARG